MSRIAVSDALLLRSFEALKALIDRLGYPPTLQELADELGYQSKSTAYEHLHELRRRGFVDFKPGIPRTLRILKPWPSHNSGEVA